MAESLEFLLRMFWLLNAVEIAAYGVIVATAVVAVVVALIRRKRRTSHPW